MLGPHHDATIREATSKGLTMSVAHHFPPNALQASQGGRGGGRREGIPRAVNYDDHPPPLSLSYYLLPR